MTMETKWVKYTIKDGILCGLYKKNLSIDIEIAKEMVTERLALQNGKDYPVIFNVNGFKAPSKEARTYLATEGVKGISIGAIIVKNAAEKIILNFFFTIEKPSVPYKAFTNEEDAILWINEIRSSKNA